MTVAALVLPLVIAVETNDQVNSRIELGSFQDPSNNVRSRFRYWVPDASVDQATVTNDIRDAVSKGAGGVEFLGYYLYGGTNSFDLGGLAESDWTPYGWETPAWSVLLHPSWVTS